MSTGRHSTITAAQRGEFWRRYKAGESVLGIIGALRQRRTNIHRVLEASGGIAPVPRTRSQRVLRFGEREEISGGLAAGDSFRVIARRLDRAVFHGPPRSGSAWRTKAVSGCSRRLGGLGVGPATEALSAQPKPAIAAGGCG